MLIYTICKNKQEAKKIVNFLLKLKLIACANFWTVESIYRWNNKIVSGKEVAVYLKTRKENYKKVEAAIKKLSSAEIPCIFEIDVDKVSKQYADWVRKETRLV